MDIVSVDYATVIVAVVAALIGSTGIAGILTAGVQWTRSARLRRAIESHAKLIEALGVKTVGGRALAKANQMDALRLAAMSLLRPPTMVWLSFVLLILFASATVIVALALNWFPVGSGGGRSSNFWLTGFYVGVMVGYIVVAVFALDFGIRVRRERFVRALIRTGKVTNKTIRAHDFLASRSDDIRSERMRDRSQQREQDFKVAEAERDARAHTNYLDRIRNIVGRIFGIRD